MNLAELVDFGTPAGEWAVGGRSWLWREIYAMHLWHYERMFVTVFDVGVPPLEMPGSQYFPVDLLVLHHSPRRLNTHPATKNWRLWDHGEFRYTCADGESERRWTPPKNWGIEVGGFTQLHINKPLAGLKRGDVLCLTGKSAALAYEEGEGIQLDPLANEGVMGTLECPWFLLESVDVFRDWPTGKIDAAAPFAQLESYLQASAPHLLAAPAAPRLSLEDQAAQRVLRRLRQRQEDGVVLRSQAKSNT